MSEAPQGGAPSAPATQPTTSESVVQDSKLPGEGTIEQGVDAAIERANADATVNKAQKQAQKQAGEVLEEALEDFAQLWKTKKGKEILKVNGKQREVTDYEDMRKLAQLGLAANEKFQQAADKIKQAEAIVELLQTKPEVALQRLGFDVRKMAEEYLRNELQKEMMSPEEQKVWQMQQKLAEYEAKEKERTDAEQANKIVELQRHYENELTDKIIKAIDTYKLPKSERTISRIAEKLYVALENGYDIDPLDIAPLVKQEIDEELKGFYGHLDVDDMIRILGDDGLKKIRNYEVQRVKAKAPENPLKTQPVATAEKKEEKSSKKQSAKDFFADLEKKYK